MTFLPYTPMRAEQDELEKTTVGREPIIREIFKDIDGQSIKKSHQHWILVGPRGIGKSHVLELIYRRIGRDPERLNKWLPIRFPEEGHGIITLWDFFRQLIELSIDQLEGEKADSSSHRAFKKRYENEEDQQYAVELAMAFLTDEYKKTGRKYLLFLENLHRTIGTRITANKTDEHFLRSFLMEDESLLLIGTSITIFDKIADSQSALYGLFRTEVLEKLTFEEAMSFLMKRCDYEKNTALSQKIKESQNSVRGLYSLAGGNPRVLLMLYRITSGIHEVVKIEREFYALLEDMTAYFESRLDQLTPQQEKILIAFAEGEYTMTPIEIAKATSIEQRTVASQILRLVENGFLRREKLRDGRSSPYRLTEEIFRYWHQWRSIPGKRKLSLLVEFIALWYTRRELQEALQRLSDKSMMAQLDGDERQDKLLLLLEEAITKQRAKDKMGIDQAHIDALLKKKQYDEAVSYLLAFAKNHPENSAIPLQIGRIYSCSKKEFKNSLSYYEKAIKIDSGLYEAYFGEGNALARLGQIENDENLHNKACEKYRKVLRIKPDHYQALSNWGNALSEIAKMTGDEKHYNDAFDKYLQALNIKRDYQTLYNWGTALSDLARAKRDEQLFTESFEKYRQATEIKSDIYEAFYNWGNNLVELGRIKKDEKLYREGYEKYQKVADIKPDDYGLFLDWGNALSELAEITNDEELYMEAFRKFRKAAEIKPDYHEAFNNWGKSLSGLAQIKKDENLHGEAVEKFQKAIEIKPDKDKAFFNWGKLLADRAQIKRDENLYQQAFEKYQKATEINPNFYMALVNWGSALDKLAMLKKDKQLFLESAEKCRKAVEIKPDGWEAFNNWGNALLGLALLKNEAVLFVEAAQKYSSCWEIYKRTKPEFHLPFVSVALNASRLFLISGKRKKAELIFDEILESIKEKELESTKHLFYQFFLEILKAKKLEEARQFLEMIQKSKFSRSFDFLSFFEPLIRFISTSDELILKSQPQELQDVLREMVEEAKQIKELLQDHPDYRYELCIYDEDFYLSIPPLHPDGDIPKIEIRSPMVKGALSRESFEKFISDLRLTLGSDEAGPSKMLVGGAEPLSLPPWKFEAIGPNGEKVTIDYIAMKRIRADSKKIEAGNIGQNIPLSLHMVLSLPEGTVKMTISIKPAGFRPAQILKSSKFLRTLKKGGKFRIVQLESGESIKEMQISEIKMNKLQDQWLDLLRYMILIEEKTGARLILPDKISETDISTIQEMKSVFETGRVIRPAEKLTLPLPIDTARRLLEINKPAEYQHGQICYQESGIELFGVKIPLGPFAYSFEGKTMQSNEELSLAIEKTPKDGIVEVDIELKDQRVELQFKKWLPDDKSSS